MNCFQIVKSVLDDTYDEIPGSDRDEQILARLTKFRKEYQNLLSGHNIRYEDPVSRFAYIYAYVTSHANMVCHAISSTDELAELFHQDRVTASCVGGGPGSDLVGILKYLDRKKNRPAITAYLLDKNKTWKECWCDLDSKVEMDLRLSTPYMDLDVCDPDSYSQYFKYLKADLFTFVYFISEVFPLLKKAKQFFDGLFTGAKSGSLMLFVDNNDSRFYEWFDKMAKTNQMDVIAEWSGRYIIPNDEEKSDLSEYFDKFGSPKIQSNMVYRVAQKR